MLSSIGCRYRDLRYPFGSNFSHPKADQRGRRSSRTSQHQHNSVVREGRGLAACSAAATPTRSSNVSSGVDLYFQKRRSSLPSLPSSATAPSQGRRHALLPTAPDAASRRREPDRKMRAPPPTGCAFKSRQAVLTPWSFPPTGSRHLLGPSHLLAATLRAS